jgi:hypothetical protein
MFQLKFFGQVEWLIRNRKKKNINWERERERLRRDAFPKFSEIEKGKKSFFLSFLMVRERERERERESGKNTNTLFDFSKIEKGKNASSFLVF